METQQQEQKKAIQLPLPLKPGEILYEDDLLIFRTAKDDKEFDEIEKTLIHSFKDNMRYQLFGVTEDILAHTFYHTREWDRKYGNRVGAFDRKTGIIVGAYRAQGGDMSELPPEPKILTDSVGYQRVKAMNKRLEERARKDFPEYFQDGLSLIKSNGGTVRPEYRDYGYGKGSF